MEHTGEIHNEPLSHHSLASLHRHVREAIINSIIVGFLILVFLLLLIHSFHKAMALSPAFELQELVNKNHQAVFESGSSEDTKGQGSEKTLDK